MNEQPTKAYGLVRDKDGNPKFDHIHNIPLALWNMLSADEQAAIRGRGGKPEGERN